MASVWANILRLSFLTTLASRVVESIIIKESAILSSATPAAVNNVTPVQC